MTKRISSFYLGRTLFEDTFRRHHVAVRESCHHLTIACTGAGKSTTNLWPVIATWDGDIVVLDPKGEHARKFFFRRQPPRAGARTTRYHLMDGRAFVLDPFGAAPELPGVRCDPMAEVDVNDDRARSRLGALSDAWVLSEGPRNQHFTEMSRLWLEAAPAHGLSQAPPERRTLPHICDLLMGIDPTTGIADPERIDQLLEEMLRNNVAGGIAQLAAAKIGDMGENERGSVMSTVARSVKWMTDPAMRRHLAGSDFRLSDIGGGEGPVTVFVVLPFAYMSMNSQARWMRTIVNMAITLLQGRPGGARRSVLLALDEFPQIADTGMETVAKGIVTLRDANVKVFPLVQSAAQLTKAGFSLETFAGSSTTQIYGIRDLETAAWAARMLGKHQPGKGGQGGVPGPARDLLTPEEIMEEFGKDKPKQLVLTPNGRPMRLERLAYKPLVVNGHRFNGLPLDGHYEED